ncbi:MAG: hypothetical protein HW394_1335, partial [Acidobacteria bacterium]|nr:hypothetical protein [Acidobacteriota bacterium]
HGEGVLVPNDTQAPDFKLTHYVGSRKSKVKSQKANPVQDAI